jgi:hypothetical protein
MGDMAEHLLGVAAVIEQKVDEEINRMDRLDEDGLEAVKRKRMEEMRGI